jgi:hypothetical protein
VYILDLETMLEVLTYHRRTGVLSADLPSGGPMLKEACHLEIMVDRGKVRSCSITDQNGHVLMENEQALQMIKSLGVIRWRLSESAKKAALQELPATAAARSSAGVPRRLVHLGAEHMASWPRLYRSVYALIDGQTSLERIARMLFVMPGVVEQVISDLRSIRVVDMD